MSEAPMTNLSFNDGFQKVSINEDTNRMIRWNPNDVGFVDRFIAFQDWVESDFKVRIGELKIGKGHQMEDYEKGSLKALGDELCGAINEAFMGDVSTAAFAGVNPCSPMSNGNLLFMNFLEALMPVIERSVKDFESARKKYTDAAKGSRKGYPRTGLSPLA